MNKIFITLKIAFFSLLIASISYVSYNGYIWQKQLGSTSYQFEKAKNEILPIKESVKKLSDELALFKQTNKEFSSLQKQIESTSSKLEEAKNEILPTQESVKELSAELTLFKKTNKDFAKYEDNKIAFEAFAKAEEAKASGNNDLALIYALNGLNNSSKDIDSINKYIDMIKSIDGVSLSEIEKAKNILELALYQVNSKDIPAVIALIENLNAMTEVVDIDETEEAEFAAEIKKELDSLKTGKYAWETLCKDNEVPALKVLEERIEVIKVLSTISDEHQEFLSDEMGITITMIDFTAKLNAIKYSISGLERNIAKSGQKDDFILNQLQLILSDLDAAMLTDRESIEKFVNASSIIKDYWNNVNDMKNAYLKAISVPAYQKALKAYNGKYLAKTTPIIEEMSALFADIYNEEMRSDIAEKLKELNTLRLKKYNTWATNNIIKAYEKYKSYTRVDQVDAINIIYYYDLYKINKNLIVPDAMEVFSELLAKAFEEITTTEKYLQYKRLFAESDKRTLEDF
ncbi:MAG: hypothetical protein R3Y46_08025 [Opitutales bacterium]